MAYTARALALGVLVDRNCNMPGAAVSRVAFLSSMMVEVDRAETSGCQVAVRRTTRAACKLQVLDDVPQNSASNLVAVSTNWIRRPSMRIQPLLCIDGNALCRNASERHHEPPNLFEGLPWHIRLDTGLFEKFEHAFLLESARTSGFQISVKTPSES